jgi:hypothetical protein
MMTIFKLALAIVIIILWMFFIVSLGEAVPVKTLTLPLDCRQSSIQAGIPVRRNSDGRITKIDVCGAADSGDDTFRDIPYQAQCEQFDTGQICR